jgi:hypothetical protein
MRIYIVFVAVVVLALLHGCTSKTKNTGRSSANLLENNTDSVYIDSVLFSLPREYSGNGIIQLMGDSIYFVDRMYTTITAYSLDGAIGKTNLGKGEGPNEVTDVLFVWRHKGDNYVYFPPKVWRFNSDWQLIKQYFTNFGASMRQTEELLYATTTNEETKAVYTVQFGPYTMMPLAYMDDERLLFPVAYGTPHLNAYEKVQYYQKVHTLGKFNSDFEVIQIIGNKPSCFLDYRFIPNHDYTYFDYSDNKLFVGFEPDSLINVYDKDMRFLYSFGRSGIDMNMDYLETSTIDEGLKNENYYRARAQEGYYEYVNYFKTPGVLIRTYKTGARDSNAKYSIENPTRLQVYKDEELVYDFPVKRRFRIIGYREPYFYADGIVDEENERLGVYRFRFNLQG